MPETRNHSGPQLRAMVTSELNRTEAIAVRCNRAGFPAAGECLKNAVLLLAEARISIASKENEVGG